MGVSVPPVPSYQANPWVAAIMGLLRGGLQGHAMDVSTREHTADRLAKQQATELAQRRQAALDESTLALNKARVDEAVARSKQLLAPRVTPPSKPVMLVGEDGTPVFVDPTNPQLPEGFRVRGGSPPAPRNIDPLSREGIRAQLELIRARAKQQAQGGTGQSGSGGQQVVATPDGYVIIDKGTGTSRPVLAPGDNPTPAVPGGAEEPLPQPGAPPGRQLQPLQRNPLQQKAIDNRVQAKKLDRALGELDAHRDAVGIKRGVPIIGDYLNQRYDPEGVNARADIADVGSLLIHERSGSAVTISEAPRFAPFVPKITDTYETTRKKLLRLRQLIEEESQALESVAGSGSAPAGGGVANKYGIQPTRR